MGKALRIAAYLVGGGTAVSAAFAALGGLYLLVAYEPDWGINLEVPIVLVALAFAANLLPHRFRVNAAALALSLAIESAAILVWTEDPTQYDALPTIAFMLCALVGLTSALASGTVAGRCTGWSSLTLWVLVTGLAAGSSETMSPAEEAGSRSGSPSPPPRCSSSPRARRAAPGPTGCSPRSSPTSWPGSP